MIASRQLENPFNKGFVRQRGKGFDALAQVVGTQTFRFLHMYVVAAAKCRKATEFLELAGLEIAEFVGGKNSSRQLQKMGLRKKKLGTGSRKKSATRLIPNKPAKQLSRSTILQTLLPNHVK